MASFKCALRLLKSTGRNFNRISVRRFSFNPKLGGAAAYSRPLIAGTIASVGFGAYTAYHLYSENPQSIVNSLHAAELECQPSVISGTKQHAVYIWIHLSPQADAKACAKIVSNLQKHIDSLYPKDGKFEENEIWAGVGFGPNYLSQVLGKTQKNYSYPHRTGIFGELPSTGGDIFIHGKSDELGKLYELSQKIKFSLPAGSIKSYQDVYGWVFQNGRDLSGFIDGTENPADDESRAQVAVEPATGGSYCITQRWIHDFDVIKTMADKNLEAAIGRSKEDSVELSRKPASSHVARMTSGPSVSAKKPFEIVRQSQPYGTVSGDSGLFFIGYAASPENFEYMLDRMVGAAADGIHDEIMKLTHCVSGNYWYFPSNKELRKLQ